jgi:hypothetical protein
MTRIVFCVTTIPDRFNKIYATLNCALNQLRPFDQIYVTIPEQSKSGKNFQKKDFNDFENYVANHKNGLLVKILRPKIDYGSIMKFLTVLEVEKDPETLLLIGDDDRFMGPLTSSLFLQKSTEYPNAALSCSGWAVGQFPCYLQFVHSFKEDKSVDWLQGTDGILLKRKFFESSMQLIDYSCVAKHQMEDLYKINDDHWIAYLLSRQKVPRIVIGCRSTDYFSFLEHSKTSSISGRSSFYYEIAKICHYSVQQGVYNTHIDSLCSFIIIGFLILFSIVLFLTLWCCFNYHWKSKRMLIPLTSLCFGLYLIYSIYI